MINIKVHVKRDQNGEYEKGKIELEFSSELTLLKMALDRVIQKEMDSIKQMNDFDFPPDDKTLVLIWKTLEEFESAYEGLNHTNEIDWDGK
ncbi:hypothetical protein [Aneurinibacillus tyrosinisolvens]|uniref:hypothetical protein n=1 Tax=Aneurinibacillus tyrosinisolvens TaxID=1443435 RepID=UPI00063F42F1|nr:hypothetical protein [Aneurinibacillus tyrosinisolvens]